MVNSAWCYCPSHLSLHNITKLLMLAQCLKIVG
nr:MAG TPA: hypothetical protein [Crassvirales sp.]